MLALAIATLLAAPDCAAWSRSFGEWLQERVERTTLPVPADPAPVEAKGVRPPPGGIPVALAKDAAFVGARRVTSGEMTDAVKAMAELHARVSPQPPALLLQVHGDVPWSKVVEAVDGARAAGIRRVAFLFEGPTDDTKRAKNWVDEETKAARTLAPEARGAKLDAISKKVYAKCEPALVTIEGDRTTASDPAIRQMVIAHDLPAALQKCGCAVDRDAAKSLELARLPEKMAGAVVFDLVAPGRTGAAVARKGSEPWSSAHSAILDPKLKGKSLVLSVK